MENLGGGGRGQIKCIMGKVEVAYDDEQSRAFINQ